ncbi:MAG: hypothetical protein MK097_07220, partial [Dechloromonas sp.]|nr:hypothetical protein [Dechloromonas sp.]
AFFLVKSRAIEMQGEQCMSEQDIDQQAERMLEAALGGMTPHEALLEASRAESADVDARAAAIAKNRERAQKLLEAIEKSLG